MIFRYELKLKQRSQKHRESNKAVYWFFFFHTTVQRWAIQTYGKSSASGSHSRTQALPSVAPSAFKVMVFHVWVTSKSTASLMERKNRGRQGQSTLFLRWSRTSCSQHFSHSITQNSATWPGRSHWSWRLPEILRCDYRCHSDWLSNHQK